MALSKFQSREARVPTAISGSWMFVISCKKRIKFQHKTIPETALICPFEKYLVIPFEAILSERFRLANNNHMSANIQEIKEEV